MRVLRFGVGLVSLTLLTLLGSLAVCAAVLPTVLGLDRLVLVSGSMAPAMVVGDIVLVDPDAPEKGRDPGAVVVFDDVERPGGVITHRVVEAHDDGTYLTQGDANATPDTSLVDDDMIHGQGRLLVPLVGQPAAMLQNDRPLAAVLVLAGVVGLAFLSRYGVQARFDPWRHPAPASGTGGRFPVRVLAGTASVAVVAGAVLVSLPGSGAAFTATTTNAANTVTVAMQTRLYLKSSGTGNVSSSATLPLSYTAPTQTTLPNYDTNRDSSPGLGISKGNGLNDSDSSKVQRWNFAGGITLNGSASLTAWSAMKGFDTSKNGRAAAALYNCNSSGGGCSLLGTAQTLNNTPWSPISNGWTSKTWNFGTISETVNSNRVLQVRIAPDSNSGDDMMFAYDTTAYPASLTVG